MTDALNYMSGFANHFATEALPGALPVGRNSPQKAPYGLYAEQISGTAFTAPRSANRRSWTYRIRPAVMQGAFQALPQAHLVADFDVPAAPDPMRWDPLPMPAEPTDFVEGLVSMAGNPACAIHLYAANRCMGERFFYDADAEMMLVPQQQVACSWTPSSVASRWSPRRSR